MHALDLPEIRSLIGTFLSNNDLAACVRVSKAWNASLLPLLWDTIEITRDSSNSHLRLTLGSHAHLIQNLQLRLPSNIDPIAVSPLLNLKTLRLAVSYSETPEEEQLCGQILMNCPAVNKLHVNFHSTKKDMTNVFRLIKNHFPHIKSLRIEKYNFTVETMDLFLNICPRLITLNVQNTRLVNVPRISTLIDNHPSLGDFSTIRHLVFSYVDDPFFNTVPFLALFKSVQSLDLYYIYNTQVPLVTLADFVVAGSWPLLEHLIVRKITYPKTDESMARILESMKICKTFQYPGGDVGPRTMEQLIRHFPTLESLAVQQFMDREDVENMRGFVPKVLSSCPRLKELDVGHLDSEKVMEGPAWVCLGLRKLKAEIFERRDWNRTRYYSQETMLDRLAQLHHLEYFWLGTQGWISRIDYCTVVDLKVGRGVEKLAVWKNLKFLGVESMPQDLERGDVERMIQQWPRLGKVLGRLNKDTAVNNVLSGFIQMKGIEYRASRFS